MNNSLTIIGLGPGSYEHLSVETARVLQECDLLVFRTLKHPVIKKLSLENINYVSCDDVYEQSENFATVYQKIAEYCWQQAQTKKVVYAVPGSPLVAEQTVVLLRKLFAKNNCALKIFPSMSFLDLVYNRVDLDPVQDGLLVVDAMDLKNIFLAKKIPLIITQVYDKIVAGELKISLMKYMEDDSKIVFMKNLGLPDEFVREIPLFELDWQKNIDHLTTVYIPKTDFSLE